MYTYTAPPPPPPHPGGGEGGGEGGERPPQTTTTGHRGRDSTSTREGGGKGNPHRCGETRLKTSTGKVQHILAQYI